MIHSTEPVCSIEYKAGKSFHMKNHGAKDLSFQLAVTGVAVGNIFIVHPGEEVTKTFPEFYSTGDTLMVINNEDVAGDYEVDETI